MSEKTVVMIAMRASRNNRRCQRGSGAFSGVDSLVFKTRVRLKAGCGARQEQNHEAFLAHRSLAGRERELSCCSSLVGRSTSLAISL